MDIEGCLVVVDALNCPQKTVDAIVRGKRDYLLDAKGNQPTLERKICEYVQDDALRKGMDCESKTEKNRDRTETRTAYSTDDVAWLYGKEKWGNLNCIGALKTEFKKDGRKKKNGTIISPAGNSPQQNCFGMPVWNGQRKRCTGCWMYITAKIIAALKTGQSSRI